MTFIKGLFRNTRHLTLNNLKEKLRQVLHPFRGRNKIILRCDMNYAGEKKKIYIHSTLRDDSIQFQSYNEIFFPDLSFCYHDNLHSIFPFVTGIFFIIGILILWVGIRMESISERASYIVQILLWRIENYGGKFN